MPRSSALSRLEPLLESTTTRIVLSFLIVISVLPDRTLATLLPEPMAHALPWILLAVFVPELVLRSLLWRARRSAARSHPTRRSEGLLLALDLVAVLSFLPFHLLWPGLASLRLLRLGRMLLLVGYWGRTFRELWSIIGDRERRGQLIVVLAAGALLAFTAAVVLASLAAPFDFDESGALDGEDQRFSRILWWALLQVEDPGNLVRQPGGLVVLAISLGLTVAGVLLFSFLVGVGTSAVEELVRRGRERPPGFSGHNAILALGSDTTRLVDELAALYQKNRRRFRAAVLTPEPPSSHFERSRGRAIARRAGDPLRPEDLDRIDLDRARRAVLVPGPRVGDGALIAGILAVRARREDLPLFAVVEHERDFAAARHAGGAATTVVGAASFIGHVLARTVLDPGSRPLLDELLTAAGCELYTYLLEPSERAELARAAATLELDAVRTWGRQRATLTVLGVFLSPLGREKEPLDHDELEVVLDPRPGVVVASERVRGIVAIAAAFESVRQLGQQLAHEAREARPAEAVSTAPIELRQPPAPRRILVCGASGRLPRLTRLLAESAPGLRLDIVVRRSELVAAVRDDILDALAGHLVGIPGEAPIATTVTVDSAREARRVEIELPGDGRITLAALDWTDPVRLLGGGRGPLAGAEVVVLAPGRDEVEEGDGQVALDALRLAELARRGGHTRPELRVVALVRDAVRADLLGERLARDGAEAGRFLVLSANRLHDRYVVQSLFVRGLTRAMLELLGPHGARLERRVPVGAVSGLEDGRLVASLAAAGATLVGVELERRDAAELVLEPSRLATLDAATLGCLRAVYVVVVEGG